MIATISRKVRYKKSAFLNIKFPNMKTCDQIHISYISSLAPKKKKRKTLDTSPQHLTLYIHTYLVVFSNKHMLLFLHLYAGAI